MDGQACLAADLPHGQNRTADLPRLSWSKRCPPGGKGQRKDRAAIVKASGGVDLSGLAARLLDAIDPDALAKRVPKDAPDPEQKAREAAKDEAATIVRDILPRDPK